MRRCIVSRESFPKAQMVRFVVNPEGVITPDVEEKLPSRGYWIRANLEDLKTIEKKNIFPKYVKANVKTPHNLAAQVESGLVTKVSRYLSLARKSGKAIVGFEKVKIELKSGQVALLIKASDSSTKQGSKLSGCNLTSEQHSCLTGYELGLAFGRESVIYVAIRKSGQTNQLSRELWRLAQLRPNSALSHKQTLELAML